MDVLHRIPDRDQTVHQPKQALCTLTIFQYTAMVGNGISRSAQHPGEHKTDKVLQLQGNPQNNMSFTSYSQRYKNTLTHRCDYTVVSLQ